jgi:hypothetical protein
VAGKSTGEYIKLGMTVNINSNEIAIQQLQVYATDGRLK